MNKLQRYLLKLALISLTFLLTCCGITSEKNFYINKVWSDSNTVYVRYVKSDAIYHYSPFNINGDLLTKEKLTSYHYNFPRTLIKPKTTINLENGNIASSSIYEDQDFKVTGDGKNTAIYVDTKSTSIASCSGSIWSPQGVIRSNDKLFYCGNYFSQTGQLIQEIPKSVVDELTNKADESHPEKRLPSLMPPVFDFAISDNRLLITSDYISTPSVLKIAMWPLENGGKLSWQNISIPVVTEGFTIANHYNAYAPSGFVLRPNITQDFVLYCEQLICKKINVNKSYVYLLFDSEHRELLTFTSETVGSPLLTVYKSNY
jgi:hypothetical protein